MPHEGRGHGGHGFKWILPPEVEAALPEETRDEINAIRSDESLSRHEKHDRIMSVLDSLPEDVRAQLPAPPLPPWVQHLPDEDRERFEAVHSDTSLGFREKRAREREFLDGLPDDVKEKMRRERSRSRGRMRGCWKGQQKSFPS
ncbi:unnamed protein product, partial [Mesorhabditis belari]|uniref:Uncharacterized protein n=1 Tax=Mesorhabditis belari TaxID=2138241 RepID=A0AAF3E8V3_9BILA